ncbi:hypothetical protein CPBBRM18_IMEEAPEM_02416 [Companilactobacillus paralimentarius]
MHKSQKISKIKSLNKLLKELNSSLPPNADNLKSTIQKVYFQINKSDNVSKNYNEIHDALITLNNALQQAALKKTYHFSPAQNKIIHEINSVEHKSFWQQISTIVNGPAFFHS